MSIALLLRRAMPGSRASISAHIERGERIARDPGTIQRWRSTSMAGQACALGARSVGATVLDQHPLRLLADCARTCSRARALARLGSTSSGILVSKGNWRPADEIGDVGKEITAHGWMKSFTLGMRSIVDC
jgi:hypothetical protein